ncbi:MAG: transcription elongation factor GreA [Campylobacteraceae bacterium]|nr:transcription elongation factor GreA [Campylobacteraceae bacterium]
MEKEPMTNKGYEELTALLSDMKLSQRPKIVIDLDEARQLGDLKENAEYHAAKEDLANMDKKIAETEDTVSRSIIIDPAILPHDKVSFGSSIVLIDLDTDEEINYTIVGSQESNPEEGLISFNSPLAKQLLGKEEGDEVKAKLPGGIKEFEVEKVFYKG